MNLFEQILNQSKLGTAWQFSGGTSFGSINSQDFQSKAPAIQNRMQVENQMKTQFWLSDRDVKFLSLAKDKGYSFEDAITFLEQQKAEAKQAEQQAKWILGSDANRQGFMQNALWVWVDFLWWITSEVPKVIWETASWMSRMGNKLPTNTIPTAIRAGFSDKTYWELRAEQDEQSNFFQREWAKSKQDIQNMGFFDPNSTSTKVWEGLVDIWSTLIWPNKAKVLKEWTGLATKYIPKAINLAQEGAVMWAKYDIATKWEITPEWVGYWAGGNLVFGAWLNLIGKTYNWITRRLPASLTLGGLINPWKLDVVKKWLQVDEGIATPEDIGKWILDRTKPWNKQEIAEQLIQHAEKTRWAVDEALASIPTYFKNPTAKKALLQIRADLEWKTGLEWSIAKIDELLSKPDYTLSELNAIKRELDEMYNLYTKSTDPTAWLKAQWLRNVRADLRKFIEDEAEKYGVGIRKLNNETATARGLAEGILRKDSADWVRELLTAFAPSGAWAVVWAWQAMVRWEDPLTVLRDAMIWAVATKIGTSTAVRTRIASALNRLAQKDLTALENYIRSWGKDAIGKKVAEKVIREWRALPARTLTTPDDFAKPPEKAIITPQTQERAIITESQKGLSSNVKRPNGNTNNTSSNSSNIPVWSKKVQKSSTKAKKIDSDIPDEPPPSTPKTPSSKKKAPEKTIDITETSQQWADRLTFKNWERKYDYYTLVRWYNDVLKNGKESGFYKNADEYIKSEIDKLITPQKTIVKPKEVSWVNPKNTIYKSLEEAQGYVKFHQKNIDLLEWIEKPNSNQRADLKYEKKALEDAKREVDYFSKKWNTKSPVKNPLVEEARKKPKWMKIYQKRKSNL